MTGKEILVTVKREKEGNKQEMEVAVGFIRRLYAVL